jgi:hypothetical protein
MILGTAGTLLAAIAGLIVFTGWWLGRIPVLGYVPLMLAITFFGGLTALGLGIVGQYQWLTLQNSRGRPPFVIKSTWTFEPSRADAQRERAPTNSS